jgi:hypothetical protein
MSDPSKTGCHQANCQSRRRWTLLGVLGILSIAVVVIILGLPTIQAVLEAQRRLRCRDNLHLIVAALHSYHDNHKMYPPAYVLGSDGERMHSWRVLILKELGYPSLYGRYRWDEPWNSLHNRKLIAEMPVEYGCPSDTTRPTGVTNYVAVVGCQTAWPKHCAAHLAAVTDGLRNTLQVVESSDLRKPWTEPTDLTYNEFVRGVNSGRPPGFSSRHPGGALLAMMDGSVEFCSNATNQRIIRSVASIASGDPWPDVDCDPLEVAVDSIADICGPMRSAESFQQTDVHPVIDVPMAAGRNLLYCATFQIVWDDLRDVLGVESIHFEEAPPLAERLNARRFPRDSLATDSYVAFAGTADNNISGQVDATRRLGLPSSHWPDTPPSHTALQAVLEAYCYLEKRLPFATKFKRHEMPLLFHSFDGIDAVVSFGRQAEEMIEGAPESQVSILHYRSDQDFVLRMQTLDDPILLAKIPPAATLRETWQTVVQRMHHPRLRGPRKAELLRDETLTVPLIAVFVQRDYHELIGLPVVNAPARLPLGVATQYIKFQLDETGARLESESRAKFVSLDDDPDDDPNQPRQFVFDRPFLLALQQAGAEEPYLVLWVANRELLVRAGAAAGAGPGFKY